MRLLGHGELKAKLSFEVAGVSQSAIKAVEAQGGTVTVKSITGREAPPADKIKADKRAAKRAALAAAPKGGKKKAAQDADEGAPAKADAGAAKATGEPKSEEGEAKKKPAKKDKSE